MVADTIITKLQNGNVVITKNGRNMSYYPDMQVLEDVGDSVHVRDKSSSQQHVFHVDEVIKVVRKDGTETPITDKSTLFYELSTFFFFKLGSGGSTHLGVFDNYTDLVTQYPTAATGDLAYVENSQGTFWLPGGMGGNFYSKGVYMYNGANWDSSVDEIAKQLEENTNDILSLQMALTSHVNDLNNPHDTSVSNLDDTTITAPLNGETLIYQGGQWINTTSTIAKGTSLVLTGARKKNASFSYVEIAGLMSNESSIEAYEDMTLHAIMLGSDGNETWIAEVHGNGVSIGSLSVTSSDSKSVTNLGINVLQGVKISLYCNGSQINKPRITAIFKTT
jgi:hypothetical protein